MINSALCLPAVMIAGCLPASAGWAAPLHVLFLGEGGLRHPVDRFQPLGPARSPRGIERTCTESLDALNPEKLANHDALPVGANPTHRSPDQEKAPPSSVEDGHGLVAVDCASFCFLNSPKYVELVGAPFKSHGRGVFKETIVKPDHPVMKGPSPIESWDERCVHAKHNTNRVVPAGRRDDQGNEPHTWVREPGRGRAFHTAWGHDQRTWGNPRFTALIENGIRRVTASRRVAAPIP